MIFPLHWRGINITPEESTARRILISPGMPARLDVAAALPMEDIDPDDPVVRKAAMSGQVTFMNLGSDMKYVAERRWNGAGCWLGQPGALYNPDIRLDAYVRPGTYRVNVTVGCADGEGDRREYDLVSPDSWDGLRLYRTQ
ncbi:MAG: hypothetical protein QF672_03430 [SAR202 cluster bacterium]|nr:hypothetical protein [SAR202 cluster bacterium]